MSKSLLAMLLMMAASCLGSASAADDELARIIDEGFNHGQVVELAAYLTDRIGGRMTNSPQMRAAERWTQEQFRSWGLRDVRTEGFDFGRGWSIANSSVRMTAPRVMQMRAIPVAWTPATAGTLSAAVIVAPVSHQREFAAWKGKLRGRIVLVSQPTLASDPTDVPFRRLSESALSQLDTFESRPALSAEDLEEALSEALFEAQLDSFLVEEGALAWVRMSHRDSGLVHGEGTGFRAGDKRLLPGVELAAEDYRLLARLAKTDATPTLEIISDVQFHDDDLQAYNVLADIAGRDTNAGYVMAGAHLDSWVAASGAQDNAAGSAIVLEAARILAKLKVRPRRGIRFALWAGEEQGALGSFDYIERYLATRAPLKDARLEALPAYDSWPLRWPLQIKPGYQALRAYFNIDNGSGKLRGLYTEGNLAAMPLLREWLEPLASMGAAHVVVSRTGITDHLYMQAIGLPAFMFIQDPLDYNNRIHHTSLDSFDHMQPDDLRQAAVVLASVLLQAANSDRQLPRTPVPTEPR
ncbi:M20/M25/M40 family metallo-hydrolase [Steroidobacter sp.]|uniref:M20/M25/M40 family metallo-hydrolase n=1 Tax=Steroidobacter sp. TaxID=1978227 RepID=UPI001A4B53C6|nr:M20/M25/M40 family metallo-hydrolase [Steroidobacter sp.]MBL8267754.1 M20/M25/M40 family metallo-hydrolase [Steroidobacter sp.]